MKHQYSTNVLAIALQDSVVYVEVPSLGRVFAAGFHSAAQFWRFLPEPHGFCFETYSQEEWEASRDELVELYTDALWTAGLSLFVQGAEVVSIARAGETTPEVVIASADGRGPLWRAAHKDTHAAYLFTRDEARRLVEGDSQAPAISHHQHWAVVEAVRREGKYLGWW